MLRKVISIEYKNATPISGAQYETQTYNPYEVKVGIHTQYSATSPIARSQKLGSVENATQGDKLRVIGYGRPEIKHATTRSPRHKTAGLVDKAAGTSWDRVDSPFDKFTRHTHENSIKFDIGAGTLFADVNLRHAKIASATASRNGLHKQKRTPIPWGEGIDESGIAHPEMTKFTLAFKPSYSQEVISPVIIPVLKVYIIMNNIEIVRLDTNKALNATTASLSTDAGSYCWTFSITIPGESIDNWGKGIEIAIIINGEEWRCITETLSEAQTFGKRTLTIGGRTHGAVLSSYLNTGTNTASISAFQAIGDVLPQDWTLETKDLTDWTIPINTLTYTSKTSAEIVGMIAKAAVASAQTDKVQKKLKLMPLIPVIPTAGGDELLIPDSIILRKNRSVSSGRGYNAITIASKKTLYNIKASGSSGGNHAPSIGEVLATDQSVAIALARQAFFNSSVALFSASIDLPAGGGIPFLSVGSTIKLTDTGIFPVRSVSISATQVNVRQTVGGNYVV
jgi:hypothetical protein